MLDVLSILSFDDHSRQEAVRVQTRNSRGQFVEVEGAHRAIWFAAKNATQGYESSTRKRVWQLKQNTLGGIELKTEDRIIDASGYIWAIDSASQSGITWRCETTRFVEGE